MRNYNSSFKVRLMIDRICLLALFILVLAISPLMAIDETRAELITFDEYSEGTPITDQYQIWGLFFQASRSPRSSAQHSPCLESRIRFWDVLQHPVLSSYLSSIQLTVPWSKLLMFGLLVIFIFNIILLL